MTTAESAPMWPRRSTDPTDARRSCHDAVARNRRAAADLYVGVADVVVDGEVIDSAVVTRMPADRFRLDRLLDDGSPQEAEAIVRAAARSVAVFHTAPSSDISADDRAQAVAPLRSRWPGHIAALAAVSAGRVEDDVLADLDRLMRAYVRGRGPLFDARCAAGRVRDGHGRILTTNIYVVDDKAHLVESDSRRERRVDDVLGDLAWLVMDLVRRGEPLLGRSVVHWYADYTGERHPGSLAHAYVADRFVLEAIDAAMTGRSPDRFVNLALEHLERAQVHLVILGGGSDPRRDSLAQDVADGLGWVHLSTTDPGVDTEGALLRAGHLLGLGESVVVSGPWASRAARSEARALAAAASAVCTELELPGAPRASEPWPESVRVGTPDQRLTWAAITLRPSWWGGVKQDR